MKRILTIAGVVLLMVGCGGKTDDSAENASGKKKAVKRTPPPSWRRTLAGDQPIPDRPAQGQLAGQPFRVETATLTAGGILKLTRKKKGGWSEGFTIFTFKKDGFESLYVSPDDNGVPHIHMSFIVPGKRSTKTQMFMDDYAMRIELGPEKNNRVAGKIYLCLSDDKKSWIAGTFDAEVTGKLRMVGGKPDLSYDASATLRHVIKTYLRSRHPGKQVAFPRDPGVSYSGASKRRPGSGQVDVTYKVDGRTRLAKLLLVKQTPKSDWTVRKQLEPHQVPQAHPVKAPDPSHHGYRRYIVARWLEADILKNHRGKMVSSANIWDRVNTRKGWGHCTIGYQLGRRRINRVVRLVKRDGKWVVAEELKKDELVDYRTGKVIKKKKRSYSPPKPRPIARPSAAQIDRIPTHTVRGKIRGKSFTLDRAKVSNGTLELTQGKGPKDGRYLSLLIFLKSQTQGRLAGQSIWFRKQDSGHPHIHFRYNKKQGSWRTGTKFYMSNYEMVLVLERIKDGQLRGKISLRLNDADGSRISGNFVVPVTWFREDAPDLKLNDSNTLRYLARKHLEQQHAGKKLKVTRTSGMGYSAMGDQGSGQGVVYYKIDGGDETFSKFLFAKKGSWRVARMLRKDQALLAHPLKLPTAKSWDHAQTQYIIGRWVEREMQTRHTGKGFTVGYINFKQSRKVKGVGFCKVTITVADGDQIERRIWVKKRPGGAWQVVRPLADGEELDMETGEPKK